MNSAIINNYLKTSVRNILRQRFNSAINIFGLAIGLSAFLLITVYIQFESSYDSYHRDSHELYRFGTHELVNGMVDVKDANTPRQLGFALDEEIPEVKAVGSTKHLDPLGVRIDGPAFYEDHIVSANTDFLEIFTYEVLQGNRNTMLEEPNSLVLTESKAREYFGDGPYLGKTVELVGSRNPEFVVTGIIEDVPLNTHYYFEILISDPTLKEFNDYKNWNWYNYYTYVRLEPGTNIDQLEAKMIEILDKNLGPDHSSAFDIHPIEDIYLHSDWTFEPAIYGDKKVIDFLTVISIFVIVIAWVNYINLATARAATRSMEVGIRKAIGAVKVQLVIQFLAEAFLINLLAAIFAMLLAQLFLPYFELLTGKIIVDNLFTDPSFLTMLVLFVIGGTILSGLYPALIMSRFKTVSALKGVRQGSVKTADFRKSLVIIQFSASMILVIGTLTVNKQVDYMLNADRGIDTEFVLGFSRPAIRSEEQAAAVDAFAEELKTSTAILAVGRTSNLPGGDATDVSSTTNSMMILGKTDEQQGTTFIQEFDDQFFDAVGMTIEAGRNFDRNQVSDTAAVIVNEAFLKKLNVNDYESVIGEELHMNPGEDASKFTLIGVVKDFSRTSLKSNIEPTLYFPSLYPSEFVTKLSKENYLEGIKHLDQVWAKFYPDVPLDYTFLDDRFERLYDNDTRFGYVFTLFSILALFIGSIGLFALASFLSLERTKEIGVRKVLGASISGILRLFYKDYLVLLLISSIVATPIAYFALQNWLESYSYRISFPWIFAVLAVTIVVVFALLTVGYQTYKVAILNPSKTLKYE